MVVVVGCGEEVVVVKRWLRWLSVVVVVVGGCGEEVAVVKRWLWWL